MHKYEFHLKLVLGTVPEDKRESTAVFFWVPPYKYGEVINCTTTVKKVLFIFRTVNVQKNVSHLKFRNCFGSHV